MPFINMKIRFVYSIFPAFIKYTDAMDPGVGGYAKRMFVYIRTQYKRDDGIHAHELTHVKQWWRNPLFHRALYDGSNRTRFSYEVEAFVAQILEYDISEREAKIKRFATFLATKYNLNISYSEAYDKLFDAMIVETKN
jgi:hypothetical protein